MTATEPPEWFDAEARTQWFRIVPEMKSLGLLTGLDQSAIEITCQTIADYVRYCQAIKDAEIELMQTPNGMPTQIPYVSMRNKSAELARKYLVEFGLTPASRTRLHVPSTGTPDALDELLASRPE